MSKLLTVIPISIREANEFVLNFHRHNRPTQGGKFAIGATTGEQMVGVAIVGRPVARMLDNGYTAEVTRTCTNEFAPKGTVSFLYSTCWRICQAMGYHKLITYTLQSESGASLKGAGWKCVGQTKPHQWSWSGREREWDSIYDQPKLRWVRGDTQ